MDIPAIEKFDRTIQELVSKQEQATLEDVKKLAERLTQLKNQFEKSQSESSTLSRLLSATHAWRTRLKLKDFEQKLESMHLQAAKNMERLNVEKRIWDLQKKGFILPLSKEACSDTFTTNLAEMKSLSCTVAFTFILTNRTEGELELLVYSLNDECKSHPVSLKQPFEVEAFLKLHAPLGIPLSQLQEVVGWLQSHGQSCAPLLSTTAIEQKLSALMKSCPHGAYLLHAQDDGLTLSRLNPKGQISHLKIDLSKQLGCYTIELQGNQMTATPRQFKRRLEQMGTPVRMRLHD